MKIRQGFVSNSSSSSFLVYGASINPYEVSDEDLLKMKDIILKIVKSDNNTNKHHIKKRLINLLSIDEDLIDILRDEFEEILEDVISFNDNSLDTNSYGYDEPDVVIGGDPESADDNITFGEWKDNIKKDVKFLFPFLIDNNFSWLEDCRRNG